jgi:alkaline phosphatase D
VKANFTQQGSPVIGAEFVGTSISSGAPAVLGDAVPIALASNPHIKWAETKHRGWVHCEVTPTEWRAEYRHVDNALVESSPVQTATRWLVEPGQPVQQV